MRCISRTGTEPYNTYTGQDDLLLLLLQLFRSKESCQLSYFGCDHSGNSSSIWIAGAFALQAAALNFLKAYVLQDQEAHATQMESYFHGYQARWCAKRLCQKAMFWFKVTFVMNFSPHICLHQWDGKHDV
ncbi:hypothetical protein HanRHA438_Chr11g0499441 [Helianthus annuus]|nr:hypothetical protein HanOQP8_Chr11g0401721 [Helianthus annuus]KAJ0870353.1 hypothetical protein HanRHA438_Chr11g0499441 [Helianthus annuus]